ncbi:winged helix-turn-helix domain-containing protein [Croceicoccus naphthovorans]|uniref:Uncharacterized protein n=1 Tax=Croceicoccus naphthovorans TaxID=1348774 RepID=A0A0G3XJ24_9SPHN|nr:winged helix-turn-helix domain-containing protein [Croceicoccus naphthovorans]AKM10599.1 hypothetical protein AB433_12530 [Croceicoccus naphthovorans]MBB3988820.1 DNA-binding winged helix-turn-helix (wHTH) protein/tetratricopeptide (TPR) repeat protein [Croceicoccus naphthovorans]
MTVFAFDEFELDRGSFELRRNGVGVAIEPQVLRLLFLLVENRDRLVTRDELFEVIWKGRFVSDTALSSRIKSARQALGDDGNAQRYIRTVRGEGFRFVGKLSDEPYSARDLAAGVAVVMERSLVGVFPFTFDRDEAAYLVDGLAELLIAELSAWRWFPILSRNATAGAKGDSLLDRARSLDLRYAICGRVISHGEEARLTVEVVDVASGETLFSEIFADRIDDLIAKQSEIARSILRVAAPELDGAERRRIVRMPAQNLGAWDLTLKALWALNSPSRESLALALDQLDSSIRLDPGLALPWCLKAQAHFEIGLGGWLGGDVALARNCFNQMLSAARASLDLDPRGWMGHSLASAGELWARAAYHPARYHAEEALRLNPSAGLAHHFSGCIAGFGGDPAAAIEIQEAVYLVDPDYRHATVIEADLGLWHFLCGDVERALDHLDRSLRLNSGNLRALQRRIAARFRLGDIAGAVADGRDLVALGATLKIDQIRASYPFQDEAHADCLLSALARPELQALG